MHRPCFVYILASKRNGALYVGVTNDIIRRVWQHKQNVVAGFTKKYSVHMLVWYEVHLYIDLAIAREKQIKGWNRKWKLRLIEKENLDWEDLFERICEQGTKEIDEEKLSKLTELLLNKNSESSPASEAQRSEGRGPS